MLPCMFRFSDLWFVHVHETGARTHVDVINPPIPHSRFVLLIHSHPSLSRDSLLCRPSHLRIILWCSLIRHQKIAWTWNKNRDGFSPDAFVGVYETTNPVLQARNRTTPLGRHWIKQRVCKEGDEGDARLKDIRHQFRRRLII